MRRCHSTTVISLLILILAGCGGGSGSSSESWGPLIGLGILAIIGIAALAIGIRNQPRGWRDVIAMIQGRPQANQHGGEDGPQGDVQAGEDGPPGGQQAAPQRGEGIQVLPILARSLRVIITVLVICVFIQSLMSILFSDSLALKSGGMRLFWGLFLIIFMFPAVMGTQRSGAITLILISAIVLFFAGGPRLRLNHREIVFGEITTAGDLAEKDGKPHKGGPEFSQGKTVNVYLGWPRDRRISTLEFEEGEERIGISGPKKSKPEAWALVKNVKFGGGKSSPSGYAHSAVVRYTDYKVTIDNRDYTHTSIVPPAGSGVHYYQSARDSLLSRLTNNSEVKVVGEGEVANPRNPWYNRLEIKSLSGLREVRVRIYYY